MSVHLLDGGVLRVPTATTLPDGSHVTGSRDITSDDPDYAEWLPHAVPASHADSRQAHEENAAILRSWGTAESASREPVLPCALLAKPRWSDRSFCGRPAPAPKRPGSR